ncbi:unnamed protein product [Cyclocybe aegerita]|uniref:F-box domain-containing protein n=1 Tax=Cyclocybe aegerita TaxID=1973307 RepID=A0A8S0XFK9_CYCAE|nr:unnamed protein product [Cyclocybe aegerita]
MTVLSKPLPLEIWINIVELHDRRADASTLRALSRCCRALACLCQQILFRDLYIPRSYGFPSRRAGALARLEDAFTQSPHLATFVRKVRYTIEDEDADNTTVHWVLNHLTNNLSDVKIQYISKTPRTRYLDWDTLDARLRSSITHVVESLHLKTLSLLWIKNMPLSVFGSLSSNLTKMMLHGIEVKIQPDSEELESTNSDDTPSRVDLGQTKKRRLPQIKSLEYFYHDTDGVLASRPFLFDFEQLKFLRISWGNEHQCALGKELMKEATRLKGLLCAVDSPQKSTAGLAKAMLDCSLDTSLVLLMIGLSHKDVSSAILDPDPDVYDLFLGLIEELKLLAGKNTVNTLKVHFDTTKRARESLMGCLRRLDEVITREVFPHLERFDLEFWVDCSGPYEPYTAPGSENAWAKRYRTQCRGVSAIPGLRFDCQVVFVDDSS